jgi:predicted Zn-dependent peptidase
MEYEIIRLSNGIRVVFQYQNLPVTHVCMVINAGSRDESAGKYGVAHFIEHLYLSVLKDDLHNRL